MELSLPDTAISEIVGEYGTRPLYKLLGYFSIIGLLRVHSLLGDFTLALKVMENVELNQKASDCYCVDSLNKIFTMSYALVALHPGYCLPCDDLLLRRLLLHHAPKIS